MSDTPAWPRRLLCALASRLEPARIRFVCLSVLILSLVLLIVSFATNKDGQTLLGTLGADYTGFYTAGFILNQHDPALLYNKAEQDRIHHELHPHLSEEETLPFLHPPFVAVAFRPLALLPYTWSFAVWLLISLALYLTGLAVTLRAVPALSPADRFTALLLALSFEPFVMECWLGGQLSAVGFCCLAGAVACGRAGRPFLSGLVLGLCLYKPTLLVLVVPVLVVARRFWTLLGFLLTGLILAGLTIWAVGWDTCRTYADSLLGFSRTTTESGGLILRTWKYVDLNAFTRLLLGSSLGQKLLLLVLAGPPVLFLLLHAWRFSGLDSERQSLLRAAVLTGTPVFNLYVGVYDSVLAVLGVLLTADVLSRRNQTLPPGFRAWLVGLYLVPWFSQPLARSVGLQTFTLILFGCAIYPLWLFHRSARQF